VLKPFALKNRGYPSINVSQFGEDGLAVRYSSNVKQLWERDKNRDKSGLIQKAAGGRRKNTAAQ
jgi:hypothetical protein